MKIRPRFNRLTLGCIFVLGAGTLPAASADVVLQHEALSQATVTMAITPPGNDGQRAAAPGDQREQPHRLEFVLRDNKTASAISDAHVRVNVAEKGFAGTDYALSPQIVGGVPGYSAYVSMPGRVPYRILVHVKLPRVERALEAQFEYRHHH
jgi:hypothetical protein